MKNGYINFEYAQEENKNKKDVCYKNMEEKLEEVKVRNKKQFKIFGFSMWRILAYFIIYSIIGFIIETVYGVMSKGVLESRQSFLYGPFCGIYGLGAVVMILSLQYFNQNNNRLFIGGFIVGSIIEYVMSLIGELIFHVKWWDYSDKPLNIGGRVCAYFSIFWGFLAIYLMSYLNPRIDKLIDYIKSKISLKKLKVITTVLIIFLLIDFLLTGYAIQMFTIRKVHDYNLNVANKEVIEQLYEKIYTNEKKVKFINKFFGDKKMIRTFPNLKIQDVYGNIIYFDILVGDIKPYYYKIK